MTPLTASLLVAAGGAVGALARFWVGIGATSLLGGHLPYGTFAVNVVGSFLIGIAAVLTHAGSHFHPALVVGALGGFTTFSSFSLETLRLFEAGRVSHAMGYVGASVAACLVAALAGAAAARSLS